MPPRTRASRSAKRSFRFSTSAQAVLASSSPQFSQRLRDRPGRDCHRRLRKLRHRPSFLIGRKPKCFRQMADLFIPYWGLFLSLVTLDCFPDIFPTDLLPGKNAEVHCAQAEFVNPVMLARVRRAATRRTRNCGPTAIPLTLSCYLHGGIRSTKMPTKSRVIRSGITLTVGALACIVLVANVYPQTPQASSNTPTLILVHGRDQPVDKRDQVEAEWQAAVSAGVSQAGRPGLIPQSQRRFVWYADLLEPGARGCPFADPGAAGAYKAAGVSRLPSLRDFFTHLRPKPEQRTAACAGECHREGC